MTSFESKTVRIAHSSERVFELLSDLSNLERFKGALNAPGNEKLKITGYDKDSLSIEVSPIGSITFRIIDREPNKTIKFEAENSPLPLNLWIQLVSTGENETASRITVKAELNLSLSRWSPSHCRKVLIKWPICLSYCPTNKKLF